MAYYRGVARDTLGNSLYNASVTVFDPGTTTPSSLYSDETLGTALDNPIATGEDGVYEFYVEPGYYDIQVAKSGFTTVTLSNQSIGSIAGVIEVTSGDQDTVPANPPKRIDETFGSLAWSMQYSGSFSEGTNGRIQYDGEPSITALIMAQVSVSDATGGSMISLFMYKNDVLIGSTSVAGSTISAATESTQLVSNLVVTMVTGDTISLALTRASGSATITVGNGSIAILSL